MFPDLLTEQICCQLTNPCVPPCQDESIGFNCVHYSLTCLSIVSCGRQTAHKVCVLWTLSTLCCFKHLLNQCLIRRWFFTHQLNFSHVWTLSQSFKPKVRIGISSEDYFCARTAGASHHGRSWASIQTGLPEVRQHWILWLQLLGIDFTGSCDWPKEIFLMLFSQPSEREFELILPQPV